MADVAYVAVTAAAAAVAVATVAVHGKLFSCREISRMRYKIALTLCSTQIEYHGRKDG